jgi:hypothetical protein
MTAEAVIADLSRAGYDLTNNRVIYCDTRGIWDELLVTNGAFAGFNSINESDLDAAIAIAERQRHIDQSPSLPTIKVPLLKHRKASRSLRRRNAAAHKKNKNQKSYPILMPHGQRSEINYFNP